MLGLLTHRTELEASGQENDETHQQKDIQTEARLKPFLWWAELFYFGFIMLQSVEAYEAIFLKTRGALLLALRTINPAGGFLGTCEAFISKA